MILKTFKLSVLILPLFLSACLKTRAEVSEQDQNQVYGKKMADNQMEAQAVSSPAAAVEDKDELIRNLNGRVEVLENQLSALLKEKETQSNQDSQKIVLLQEALAKMETQVQKFETELNANKEDETVNAKTANTKTAKSSDDNEPGTGAANGKKLGAFDAAEKYFSKQDWKKAILNFQKYTDESPRGKHVADAKFKIGVCFQELGMKEEAMAFFEEVVANYSKTSAGKKAKARLGSLKK